MSRKWGIDIAGPFPEGLGKVKFLIVAIAYFTKWVEVKPVATITGNQVKKFVWANIVCRFCLPGEIVLDNGKQFRDNPFKDWCEKLFWEKDSKLEWIKQKQGLDIEHSHVQWHTAPGKIRAMETLIFTNKRPGKCSDSKLEVGKANTPPDCEVDLKEITKLLKYTMDLRRKKRTDC
ncbi:reverse transcriptase domain-containing protein [Tanacetum coccineum]